MVSCQELDRRNDLVEALAVGQSRQDDRRVVVCRTPDHDGSTGRRMELEKNIFKNTFNEKGKMFWE